MITRGSALGIGFLAIAVASLAMVVPLWYLASERRVLFNALIVLAVSLALASSLFSRLRRRRGRRFPGRDAGLP